MHESVRERFLDALVPLVEGLVVGDPLDEATDVSALISTGERDRVQSWVDEAVAGGAEILAGGKVREDGVLAPTVLGDVTPDMKVCAERGVRPGRRRRDLHRRSTTRCGSRTTPATACRPRSSPPISRDALKAARTLDYGGVLVNEVPTFRADQQPYGGNRDSGNTREGPQWAVREMTEERLVIIQM